MCVCPTVRVAAGRERHFLFSISAVFVSGGTQSDALLCFISYLSFPPMLMSRENSYFEAAMVAHQNFPAVIIGQAQSSALPSEDETMTMNNGTSPPLNFSDDADERRREHEDGSTSTTSDITWPEIDDSGHFLGDLAEIHDPGYYKLSLKLEPEQSPKIPGVVSCIQHEQEGEAERDNDGDDPDATAESEYIDEIVELKLQLAYRLAEIDELKASLNRCMLDNEVFVAERSALVDEIAQCRQSGQDLESATARSSTSFHRNSILSIGRRKSDRKNGSIQMLLESNSQLLLQNAQLQIENNVLRKSLQASIAGNRQRQLEGEETNYKLQNDQKRESFVIDETASETLSTMPEHWPSLNDVI